jgi:hypothetical protein
MTSWPDVDSLNINVTDWLNIYMVKPLYKSIFLSQELHTVICTGCDSDRIVIFLAFTVLHSFTLYDMQSNSKMIGVTSGAGTAYSSRALEFTPDF